MLQENGLVLCLVFKEILDLKVLKGDKEHKVR